MTYYNTTDASGETLQRYRAGTDSQEARILAWLANAFTAKNYTPSEVLRFCFHNAVPLTSVRRALTNLCNDRQLVKTRERRDGPYGRPEYAWRLSTDKQPQMSLPL